MKRIIEYKTNMHVGNLEQLARGLNAPYLECLYDLYSPGKFIAKKWRRTIPKNFEVLLSFRTEDVGRTA